VSETVINALTIDVEDYFHPTEVQISGTAERAPLPPRIEAVMDGILEQLDRHKCLTTCFVLGWIAERHPKLIRRIADAGHEIGCHSYAHKLVYNLTPAQFRQDTFRAVRVIEDACGVTPRLYRAPSYSITPQSMWALAILAELGFTHDSSIYPIKHDRYGIPGFNRFAHMRETGSGAIMEVPVATVKLADDVVAPVGGGAYLRLLPYRYTAAGLRRLNQREGQPGCIYFHPWELDPDQPRLPLGRIARMRTYTGLRGMKAKIERLLKEFRFSTLTSVYPIPATSSPRPKAVASFA
jgi:polysaccharide deacetylase family protein (PEP-CTERM system associated)